MRTREEPEVLNRAAAGDRGPTPAQVTTTLQAEHLPTSGFMTTPCPPSCKNYRQGEWQERTV